MNIMALLLLLAPLLFMVYIVYFYHIKKYPLNDLIGDDNKLKEIILIPILEDKKEEFLNKKMTKSEYIKFLKWHLEMIDKAIKNKDNREK